MSEVLKNNNTKQNTITTIEIAKMMNMKHYKVLEKLDGTKDGKTKGLINVLNDGKYQLQKYFLLSYYKDKSGKKNKCYICTLNGVKMLLDNFRNYKNKFYLLKWYENNTNMNDEIILYERKEIEFIYALEHALSPLSIIGIRQYQILQYYIDYYIPSIKLAIEYDENNHKDYTYEKQELRQEKIEKELGCKFIRLSDANDNYYNIGLVVKEIINIKKEAA